MYKQVIIAILIGLAMVNTAYAEEATVTEAEMNISSVAIPPSHNLYPIKLFVQDILEIAVTDEQAKYELIQKHLDERMLELEYDARFNGNRNSEKLIERIQTKRIMAQTKLDKILAKGLPCVKGLECSYGNRQKIEEHWENQKRKNIEVLTKLLTKESMPEQSRKGIENALSKQGMVNEVEAAKEIEEKEEEQKKAAKNVTAGNTTSVTANMTMNYYSSSLSVVPFSRAMIYNPVEHKWYAAIITKDRATITDESTLTNPQYYVYPTVEQIITFTNLMKKINEEGGLGWYDRAQLFSLWISMNKKEAAKQ